MAGLTAALEAGPHLDEELTELEGLFVECHRRYSDSCPQHQPQGDVAHERRTVQEFLYAPPHPELLRSLSELRQEREELIKDFARLPSWPPPTRLLSERVRREVEEAAVQRNSLEAMRCRLRAFFLRRHAELRGQRMMISSRLQCYVRDWATTQRVAGPLRRQLCTLQRDLEATEARLRRLAPVEAREPGSLPVAKATTCEELFCKNEPYRESTLSCIFRGDVIVCLREGMFEEQCTRLLRRFLTRVQHLPINRRYKIWRRALQMQASMAVAQDALHAQRVPCTDVARLRLEKALAKLGEEMGIQACLRTDGGHAFARIVATEFAPIFDRLKKKSDLTSYPKEYTAASRVSFSSEGVRPSSVATRRASQSPSRLSRNKTFVLEEVRRSPSSRGLTRSAESSRANTPRHAVVGAAPPEVTEVGPGPFLKPSDWVPFVILQPRLDPFIAEQRVLLRPQPREDKDKRRSSEATRRQTKNISLKSVVEAVQASFTLAAFSKGVPKLSMPKREDTTRKIHKTPDFDERRPDDKLLKEFELLGANSVAEVVQACKEAAAAVAAQQATGVTASAANEDAASFAEELEAAMIRGDAAKEVEMAPQHLLEAYYLLRYLRGDCSARMYRPRPQASPAAAAVVEPLPFRAAQGCPWGSRTSGLARRGWGSGHRGRAPRCAAK